MKVGSIVKYPSASWVQEVTRLPDRFADQATKNGGVLGVVLEVNPTEELVRVRWLDNRIFGDEGDRWIYRKRVEELVIKEEAVQEYEEDRWKSIERGLGERD